MLPLPPAELLAPPMPDSPEALPLPAALDEEVEPMTEPPAPVLALSDAMPPDAAGEDVPGVAFCCSATALGGVPRKSAVVFSSRLHPAADNASATADAINILLFIARLLFHYCVLR
ncbi:MAG: hypothetical protein ACXWVP_07325 [Burkholderiales bacterium]